MPKSQIKETAQIKQTSQLSTELPPKSIAIYRRVSTDKQKFNTSLDNQLQQALKYMSNKGWSNLPYTVYTDVFSASITPKNDNTYYRDGLSSLLLDAQFGKFDRIITLSRDRLSRNIREAATIHSTLHLLKIPISYCKDGEDIDTEGSQYSRFFENLLNNLSSLESNITSERVKLACKHNAKNGIWNGGPPPYGYRLDKIHNSKTNSTLVIDTYESYIVKEIFSLYNNCYSVSEITHIIQERYSNNRDRVWSINTIKGILRNESYTGVLVWNKRGSIRNPRRRHSDDYIKAPLNESTSIISKEVWDLKEHIKSYNINPETRIYSGFPLKGLLYCSNCNSKFTYIDIAKSRKMYTCDKCKYKFTINKFYRQFKSFLFKDILSSFSISDENIDLLYTTYVKRLNTSFIDIKSKLEELYGFLLANEADLQNCIYTLNNESTKTVTALDKNALVKHNIYLDSLAELKTFLELKKDSIQSEIDELKEKRNTPISKDSFILLLKNFSSLLSNYRDTDNFEKKISERKLRLLLYDTIDKIYTNENLEFTIHFK